MTGHPNNGNIQILDSLEFGIHTAETSCGHIFLNKRLDYGKTGFTVDIRVEYDIVALTRKEF